MDLPASYYGKLDKRNPVILNFEAEITSFMTLMRRVASAAARDNVSYAKGIKTLTEIWRNFKHRLPPKLYQERMLQVADFLLGIKMYQLALWQGYMVHLRQFTSVDITDITDVDHFLLSFFPQGFDQDPEVLSMKVRAMLGCAQCIFEQEKGHRVLSQKGLSRLLHVLNFIRIMMQAFQQHEYLCWQLYNGTIHIYSICRYLMSMNFSAQALEYLLWASISLELSIPLMTAKYLPWIVTVYCAVCHCFYDNQAPVQAEEYARRALGKINDLAELEKQSEVSTSRETQIAYKEASIKLAAMMFKRAVFEARRKPKPGARVKTTLKDIPNAPWPRTLTERMLISLFDSSASQFLGILEALWDSSTRPLQTRVPEESELQDVVMELLSAGISLLSGTSTSEQRRDDEPRVLTCTSTLMDLAITGENGVPILSAVRFIKMLFQYKQSDVFTEFARQMLQVLSDVEGTIFRKAEQELTILDKFNSLQSSQRNRIKEDTIIDGRQKFSMSKSDEFIGLVDTLHKSVCGSSPDVQPDGDLVQDVLLFLWDILKVAVQRDQVKNDEFTRHLDKWIWCLSLLCEVAFACDLSSDDCIMTVEMTHNLAMLMESAAERNKEMDDLTSNETESDDVAPSSLCLLEWSCKDLLQKVCEVVERGLEALSKGVASLLPQDLSSSVADIERMQKFRDNLSSSSEELNGECKMNKKDKKDKTKPEPEVSGPRHVHFLRLLATDLLLELDLIHHRASLKLLQMNAVAESDLLDRIKKNKVSKALFLIQKASLVRKNMEPNYSSRSKSLLEEATALIEKAGVEERKLYMSTNPKSPTINKEKAMKEEQESPPPPPILLLRTDHSFIFAPASYYLEKKVCWYQLCGRAAEGINRKVRLGDWSLPGTGNLVPAVSGECLMKVEGLKPNMKYLFAVAAYDSQGKIIGNTIGGTTIPLLASIPVPLLSTWAHLAQVAFHTEHYAIAKRACRELWSHYTFSDTGSPCSQNRLAKTGLHIQNLQRSSPLVRQLFLTSIFIETEINIHQESLYCDSGSSRGLFIWEQEARLAECERMLVAIDLAMWLNDSSAALQAVVNCYGLLAPLIFHQIPCDPVIQVLQKCLIVLEENSGLLKQKWTRGTSEALIHMLACITYYLSRALRFLKDHQKAVMWMDRGRTLLQDVYEAQQQIIKLANKASKIDLAARKDELKSLQLKALNGKKLKMIPSEAPSSDNEYLRPLTGSENPIVLYERISSRTLQDAYQDVMKLRRKVCFIELVSLVLQRALEEGHPNLVVKWGQTVFEILSKRNEKMGFTTKSLERHSRSKESNVLIMEGMEPTQDRITSKVKQKIPRSMLRRVRTSREMESVENLLTSLASVVQRNKRQLQLRNMFAEERLWKIQLNYCIAQAHLSLFYRGLHQLLGGALQYSYSQLNPLGFSLAHSGILVQKRSSQQQQSPKYEVLSERDPSHSGQWDDVIAALKERKKTEAADDSNTEESNEDEEGSSSQSAEQQFEMQRRTSASLLDSINNAALHLHRAMVLAHRGAHWTTLLTVCHTVWEQSCRIAVLGQKPVQLQPPFQMVIDQLHNIFTPLLVLATDFVMDMLNKLGLWSLYDQVTEEDLESGLHFSPPLDDSTQVDLRWVRTLVLHTLERLHDNGKWETLAHFALLFNSYTRERYAVIVTPLLVVAQRRLLERIKTFGGPPVPQPHHSKTLRTSGKEVTCSSYASCQLVSGLISHSAQKSVHQKNVPSMNRTPQDATGVKDVDMKRSMSLVCVPLDVEDTLRCYHEALERRPHCLQVLQHSRSLLLLLLAYTQPCFGAKLQRSQSRSLNQLTSPVDFSPVVMFTPSMHPRDLTEDSSAPNALYSHPISPNQIPAVTAAYSTSIKYLQTHSHESLRVLALHEMGNLQVYNGNTRAANSYWRKAIDFALQISDVLDKWNGVSFGGGTLQQTLKQAGIWGCLQAAGLTAKIAQYILTTDISERTKCCLLSAHLFKCVLCCSLAQPNIDLQYASHIIGDELLPGVDLFSHPYRVHLGTTVTSLHFICQWLFITGHHMRLLSMLALYIYFVGTVCRDVQRTIEGKILKIQTLSELCLFTDAVREAVQLAQETRVAVTNVLLSNQDHFPSVKLFNSNKSLPENTEALEELVKCDLAPEVSALYGSTLSIKFSLACVQLILALCNTVHSNPLSGEDFGRKQDLGKQNRPSSRKQKHKVLTFSSQVKLTPEKIKFLLLEEAAFKLDSISQDLESQPRSETENLELKIGINLLKSNLHLQQRHAALSAEAAASALVLMQSSPSVLQRSMSASDDAASDPVHTRTETEQSAKDCNASHHSHGDSPREVECSERIGSALWLRCRVALFRSLAAQLHRADVSSQGKKTAEATAQALQEGLDDCALLRDVDIQALLMVEGAEFNAKRGKIEDSVALLQEGVSRLSGQIYLPPGSSFTLARATILLSKLRGAQSGTLLKLTEKLLQKQLRLFGEHTVLDNGKICFPPPGPKNIYLPYLPLIHKITLQKDQNQDSNTTEMSDLVQSPKSAGTQSSFQPSRIERDAQPHCLDQTGTSSPPDPQPQDS